MSIHELLNILVLTLSLATVFITLLTYLIHKIRQLPKSDATTATIRRDGVYFKRYFGPLDMIATKPELAQKPAGLLGALSNRGYRFFFALLCVVIFLSIFFERNVSQWKHTRVQRRDAEVYSSRVDMGLMKEYDLNPGRKNPELVESISESQAKRLDGIRESLKARKIIVVQTPQNAAFTGDKSSVAIAAWKKFLDQSGISYASGTAISDAKGFNLLILPQAKVLTALDRANLRDLAAAGIGILATGPAGYVDEKGTVAATAWSSEMWGFTIAKNEDSNSYFPTLFSGGVRAPWWEVPPGFLVNWFPTDNGFQYTSSSTGSMAYEANYQGRWRSEETDGHFVRAVFGAKERPLLTWLALDPPDNSKLTAPEQHYVSSALFEALRWSAAAPSASIGLWKSGAPNAFVASVDSEDEFSNAVSMLKIFKEEQFPATFFVVSNLLKENSELARQATSKYELASHTDDHGSLEGKTLSQQFEHIQNSRFGIEYFWGHPVYGFRPPEEGFDPVTLNAILQNRLEYIFGDQHFHRFAPVQISDGQLTYFPRSALDDFNLVSKKGVFTERQAVQAMLDDHARIAELGGAYFLSLHTQIYGKPERWGILRNFLKDPSLKSAWKSNFVELQTWWQARQNVELKLVESERGDAFQLVILNHNQFAVEDVALNIETHGRVLSLEKTAPGVSVTMTPGTVNQWVLKSIGPAEQLTFNFNVAGAVRTPASTGN